MQKLYFLTWVDEDNHAHSEMLAMDKPSLIGRAQSADITVDNPSVSRVHAQLSWQGDNWVLQDLQSSYGTWVKNKRVDGETTVSLYENSEIRLGNLSIWFEVRDQNTETDSIQTCFFSESGRSSAKLTPELTAFKAKVLEEIHALNGDTQLLENLTSMFDRELAALSARHEDQLKEQRILNSISHILNRSVTLSDISHNALNLISKVLSADRGFIVLRNEETDNCDLIASRNFSELNDSAELQTNQSFSNTLVKRCFDQGEIILLDEDNHAETFDNVESLDSTDARSIVVIPLHDKDVVFGVIYLDSASRAQCFEHRHTPFLETFAVHTSIALQNSRLYKWAITDDLTQLYNRKYIDERLEQEIERARRYQRPFSVLLLDLDHFKQINDNHGHSTGDQVLQHVSSLLREQLRDTDIAGRFGGEEFVIIMGETRLEGARLFAERLRESVQQHPIEKDGEAINVTVSIGVASYNAANPPQASSLIEMADNALYLAKEDGRNQVIVAG